MARNLYILAGTLFFFSLVTLALSFTHLAHQPGSPGDVSLWRTMSIAFFCLSLLITLAGMMSRLFEQAERRAETARQLRRKR